MLIKENEEIMEQFDFWIKKPISNKISDQVRYNIFDAVALKFIFGSQNKFLTLSEAILNNISN